jgi:serine/threonine protein kinase
MTGSNLTPSRSIANRPRTHTRWRASLRVTPLLAQPTNWQTINISEGGAFVASRDLLPLGSMLDLGLWLAAERITGKAEVVWANDPSRPGSDPSLPIGMGLKFLGLGERDRRLFKQFLRDLERRLAPAVAVHPKPPVAGAEPPWVASADLQVDQASLQGGTSLEAPPDVLPAGTILGSYRTIRRLGCGGMGDVYLAEHTKLGRRVAVKRLHARYATDRLLAARFLGEARVVNQICHPNIVEITDFCGTDEQPYFVMELLTGQTLEEAISTQGALPLGRLLHISLQLSAVLAVVHDKGVIHRDLKPQNLFLTERDGQSDFVKLLDFGIAKLADLSTMPVGERTAEGIVLGTPGYMAPEQLDGEPVDVRSDIYAFGIVLYQMATGRAPFLADSWGKLILQQATQTPPRPSDIAGRPMPASFEALILDCLARDPDARPPSMAAIYSSLEELRERMADPLPTEPVPAVVPPPSPTRRSGIGAALAGIAVMVAVGAVGASRVSLLTQVGRPAASIEIKAVEPAPTVKPTAVADPVLVAQPSLEAPSSGAVVGAATGPDSRRGKPNKRRAHVAAGALDARASSTGKGSRELVGAKGDSASGPAAEVRDHTQRGLGFLRDRKPLLAIGELEQAIAIDANYAPAYRLLGSAYGLVGRDLKMIESWRRYVVLAPNAVDAAKIGQILEAKSAGSGSLVAQ